MSQCFRGVIVTIPMLLEKTAAVKSLVWSLALSMLLSITNINSYTTNRGLFFQLQPKTMFLCYGCAADLCDQKLWHGNTGRAVKMQAVSVVGAIFEDQLTGCRLPSNINCPFPRSHSQAILLHLWTLTADLYFLFSDPGHCRPVSSFP